MDKLYALTHDGCFIAADGIRCLPNAGPVWLTWHDALGVIQHYLGMGYAVTITPKGGTKHHG
jgi:hypothetical protein